MVFWLQMGSAAIGLAAAVLWFLAARGRVPPLGWDSDEQLGAFLKTGARLNMWAAGITALSVLLSAVAMLLSAIGSR
jgi:hypothetical protein